MIDLFLATLSALWFDRGVQSAALSLRDRAVCIITGWAHWRSCAGALRAEPKLWLHIAMPSTASWAALNSSAEAGFWADSGVWDSTANMIFDRLASLSLTSGALAAGGLSPIEDVEATMSRVLEMISHRPSMLEPELDARQLAPHNFLIGPAIALLSVALTAALLASNGPGCYNVSTDNNRTRAGDL